ncbi:GNAT family N-acetyltransferase [Alkalihalobacillus sp. FSL R5-0424]
MMRQLYVDDHDLVLTLFKGRVLDFGFLLDELLANNYESQYLKAYGEFEQGNLVSILMHNGINISYYSNETRDLESYNRLIFAASYSKISGVHDMIEPFARTLTVKEDVSSYLGYIEHFLVTPNDTSEHIQTIRTEEEWSQIYDLLASSAQYSSVLPANKSLYISDQLNLVSDVTTRTCCLILDGEMVATASTISEYKQSAIITGVYTNSLHRGRGFACKLLVQLCLQLLKEGKVPYFFYNNPKARSLYKKIGMVEACKWRVLYK